MSNEETLQEYNNNLAGNNEALRGVLNMIDELSDADLTGYATVEYVDEAIANIDIPDSNNSGIIELRCSGYLPTDNLISQIKNQEDIDKVVQAMVEAKNSNDIYPPSFLVHFSDGNVLFHLRSSPTTNTGYKSYSYIGTLETYGNPNSRKVYTMSITVNGIGYMESTPALNGSYIGVRLYREDKALNVNNTTEFTPTADYHPATKKYVDDTVAAVNAYSTEETVVGTWVDGKPIYRRVVIVDDIGVSPNMTIPYDFDISTVDRIWIDETAAFAANDYESFAISSYYEGDVWIKAWVNKNVGLRLRCSIDLPGYSAYITLNYTKTTDTGTEVE